MLDLFTIFTKGGIVLYSYNQRNARNHTVNQLISEVFVESRHGESSAVMQTQRYHWVFENELGLIFLIAYQKILQLAYADELLLALRQIFCQEYASTIKSYFYNPQFKNEKDSSAMSTQDNSICKLSTNFNFPEFDFEAKFTSILKSFEKKHTEQAKAKVPRRFEDTKKYQKTLEAAKKVFDGSENKDELSKSLPETRSTLSKPNSLRGKINKKGTKLSETKNDNTSDSENDKKKRAPRIWAGQVNKAKMKSLDYSEGPNNDDSSLIQSLVNDEDRGEFNEDGTYDVKDIDQSDDSDYEYVENIASLHSTSQPQPESRLMSFFHSLTGQHVIREDELIPVLSNMKEHLIHKNVAEKIASHLCDSVKADILGKKLGSFQSLTKAVSDSLRDAITHILTPGTSMDLLKEISSANQQKRPYTISFIGVNGVGKSTNLSKVCFWLLQNRKRVLVAACDTFRSGAVEQLGVHVRNLKKLNSEAHVQLYERGYGKDSANIAADAIEFGKQNGFDVVLIDTAGRMQNNESLMKALAKLIAYNQPDKVLFVGEALVGNEAVDQLQKFNLALQDFSGSAQPRQIDGLILTKFDTIDDKVGAALSMTFTARAPILFVGTGQTYTDLKKMNVDHVVNSLLKK